MFDFARSFASPEKNTGPGHDHETEASQKEHSGHGGLGSGRSGSVLNFRQRAASEKQGRDRSGDAAKGNDARLPVSQEPRDPVAHPTYKTRAEGAAHPIYQLCEEPLRAKPATRSALPISKKTEVDIAIFLEAVSSAFPRPRDPLMPRVLRARPKKAARPFLYGADDPIDPNLCSEEGLVVPAIAHEGQIEAARAALMVVASKPHEVPYDPILQGDGFRIERRKADTETTTGRQEDATYDPILAGAKLHDRRKRAVNPGASTTPKAAHERGLIHAAIEPREPVAKPRFPLQSEVPGATEAKLSPSQRAHLRRPAMVRDCHGKLTAVTYRVGGGGLD